MLECGSSGYIGMKPVKVTGVVWQGPPPDENGVIHLHPLDHAMGDVVAYYVADKRGTQRVVPHQVSKSIASPFRVVRKDQ